MIILLRQNLNVLFHLDRYISLLDWTIFSISISIFSSQGNGKKEINYHPIPFFDIPISREAPTRAIYIYIYTHTFSLICLFFLSLTHSFTHFSSFMFLLVLQATTDCCVSVKAKLVLTNRNIASDICMYACMYWPTRHQMTDVTLDYKKERAN